MGYSSPTYGYKSLLTKNLLELLVSVDQNAETTGSYTDEELMDAAKKQGNHPGGRLWWGGRGSNNAWSDQCPKIFTEKLFCQGSKCSDGYRKNASQRKSIIRNTCL